MNDPQLTLERIDTMLREALTEPRAFQLAAFAASAILIERLEQHTMEHKTNDAYMSEKISSLRWHATAMFDLDVTNGHGQSTHYQWALGAINTLRGLLMERK